MHEFDSSQMSDHDSSTNCEYHELHSRIQKLESQVKHAIVQQKWHYTKQTFHEFLLGMCIMYNFFIYLKYQWKKIIRKSNLNL